MNKFPDSSRNQSIQIFRAIAIIAVVLIHTTPGGEWQVLCKPFINFAVATFIFLSGYLTKIDNDNWLAFYRKRIVRVAVPYLIWTLLYGLLDSPSVNVVSLVKNLLCANASTTLYYVFVYIQFVLLTPLLGMLAKSRFRFTGWLIAPVSVIAFKYIPVFADMPMGKHMELFWNDLCLGWFTFYYLGLLLGNKMIDRKFNLVTLVALYCVSLFLQIGEGYVWSLCDPAGCGSQLKLTALLSSSIFMLIIYVALNIGTSCQRFQPLTVIGDYSFGIYLSHMMILDGLKPLAFFDALPYPITSLIVLISSFLFCYLLTLITGRKAGRWLGLI